MATLPPNLPADLPPDLPAQGPAEVPAAVRLQDSLIPYPSAFPIKVMGAQAEGFVEAIAAIARQFDPGFDASTIAQRPSRGGKYLGLTVTITATSREQLDEVYRTLSTHPLVKVVL